MKAHVIAVEAGANASNPGPYGGLSIADSAAAAAASAAAADAHAADVNKAVFMTGGGGGYGMVRCIFFFLREFLRGIRTIRKVVRIFF